MTPAMQKIRNRINAAIRYMDEGGIRDAKINLEECLELLDTIEPKIEAGEKA